MIKSFKLSKKDFIAFLPILCIMVLFILLNINTLTSWFRSDTEEYYRSICNNVEKLKQSEISLSNLSICSHICYGYSLFVFLGEFLIPYMGIGIRIMNLILALITIGLFFRILRLIFPVMEKWTQIFITSAFAFSPFMLGIASEIHTDFPVLCFYVWLVYFYIREKKMLCILTGFLLCFSKEIGVLYYCAFFAGCFLYRLIKNKNKNWLKKLLSEFSAAEWLLLIPADLFLISSLYSLGWGKNVTDTKVTDGAVNSIVFDWYYIGIKLKELFILNFAWLLIIPVIVFIIAICRKKMQECKLNKEWMIGIVITAIAFLLFNFSYFTFVHYRYLQLFLFFYLILVGFLLEKSCQNIWLKRIISCCFAVAFLAESFVTVDPITFATFRNIDIGNGKIITTKEYEINPETMYFQNRYQGVDVEKFQFADAVVYNREYLGFERAFENALADIMYNEKKAIVFPAIYGKTMYHTIYAYLGMHDLSNAHWDNTTNNVTHDDSQIAIQWLDISDEIPDNVRDYQEIWYVKLPYHGKWYREKNLNKFQVLEERTYQSGKWKFKLEKIQYK